MPENEPKSKQPETPMTPEQLEKLEVEKASGQLWDSFRIANLRSSLNPPINSENYFREFTWGRALEFNASEKSELGTQIQAKLSAVQKIFDRYPDEKLDILLYNNTSESEFELTLADLQKKRSLFSDDEVKKIKQAYSYYRAMKSKVGRYLEVIENSIQKRERTGGNIDLQENVDSMLGNLPSRLMNNWDRCSTSEKLVFAGLGLVAGYLTYNALSVSDEDKTWSAFFKRQAKSLLMMGGTAIFANILSKVVTGKSGLDWASTALNSGSQYMGYQDVFADAFGSDKANQDAVKRGVSMLGGHKFSDLLAAYRQGAATGKIENEGMPPEQAYLMMKLILQRYPAETIEANYLSKKPDITLSEVLADLFKNDTQLNFSSGIEKLPIAIKKVNFGITSPLPENKATMLGILLTEEWQKKQGKTITPEELQKFAALFVTEIKDAQEFLTAIDKVLAKNPVEADEYRALIKEGIVVPAQNLVYKKYANGGMKTYQEFDLDEHFQTPEKTQALIEAKKQIALAEMSKELKIDLATLEKQVVFDCIYSQAGSKALLLAKYQGTVAA